uniref:hypothetical protein n=1 Tax=Heterobasidion parviporum TaxID=207832 RepID=UPI00257DD12F|nr:hypothetical protein QU375_mgp18 [Heterobasidion parviporum]WHL55393.1 hypothetical protein [Heterobasidion parviporum]
MNSLFFITILKTLQNSIYKYIFIFIIIFNFLLKIVSLYFGWDITYISNLIDVTEISGEETLDRDLLGFGLTFLVIIVVISVAKMCHGMFDNDPLEDVMRADRVSNLVYAYPEDIEDIEMNSVNTGITHRSITSSNASQNASEVVTIHSLEITNENIDNEQSKPSSEIEGSINKNK